jgi:two-component system OmpR family response regulator
MKTDDARPQFRVLCVDDNRDCADSAALLLRMVGFDVRACYDGVSALALNESFRPGTCLIDLHMRGMDGDELALRLRAGPGWQPMLLVAITAMSDEDSRARTKAAGFDFHLVKPVDPQKLLHIVYSLFKTVETLQTSSAEIDKYKLKQVK